MDIFSNFGLTLFVIVPALMLLGLWAAKSVNQVRGVMVAGSSVLLVLSVWLTLLFINMRAAGNTDEMLFVSSMPWFKSLNISYAIGVAQPTSIMIDTFGTGKLSEEKLVEIIRENFDLRPAGIIKMLDLRRPIYKQTASYGHFGRNDLNLPGEKLDKAEDLKKYM